MALFGFWFLKKKSLNSSDNTTIVMANNRNNKNIAFASISISLPEKILEKIDHARGLIPRSTFIVEKMRRVRWDK